jgi:hypothetical protein
MTPLTARLTPIPCKRQPSPSSRFAQQGNIFCYWPIATFRCDAEFGRYLGIADIDQNAPIEFDL